MYIIFFALRVLLSSYHKSCFSSVKSFFYSLFVEIITLDGAFNSVGIQAL